MSSQNSSSDSTTPTNSQQQQPPATASHPPPSAPDPTTAPAHHAAQGGVSAAAAASTAELASLKVKLKSNMKQYLDFPAPNVLFEDIMPLFGSHELHNDLITALELKMASAFGTSPGQSSDIDVIVGLESRGFLFGPTLALRLGAAFVPVRKAGKLPGNCARQSYEKEYGEDVFEMQSSAFMPGKRVVIVDDIIATGGSAAAAGKLVGKLDGVLLGYVFMMELDFLRGREKLDAPVHTLFSGQEGAADSSS